MSRYFKPYPKSDEDTTYPEDIKYLRTEIEDHYGTLTCSNRKLGELWRDFSDEAYCASFLCINSESLVREFVEWLANKRDE